MTPPTTLDQKIREQLGALIFQILVLQQENDLLRAQLAPSPPPADSPSPADALDTASSLQRRAAELEANVRHLESEQTSLTTSLEAMRQEAAQTQAETQRAQQATLARWRADADRVQAGLEAERARVEGDITQARARLEDYSARADATLADLDRHIAEKREELAAPITALDTA